MKIAIVGYRYYINKQDFDEKITEIIQHYDITNLTIISGGAKGTDTLAKKFAISKNIPFIEILPDWKKFGKKAGPIRNRIIVKKAELIIAFLSTKSIGTRDTINYAKNIGKDHVVFDV